MKNHPQMGYRLSGATPRTLGKFGVRFVWARADTQPWVPSGPHPASGHDSQHTSTGLLTGINIWPRTPLCYSEHPPDRLRIPPRKGLHDPRLPHSPPLFRRRFPHDPPPVPAPV